MGLKFKYKIEQTDNNFYIFKILEQDENLTSSSYNVKDFGIYNGFYIRSSCSPEIDFFSNVIYLIGYSGKKYCEFETSKYQLNEINKALSLFQKLYCKIDKICNHPLTSIFK